MSGPTNANKLKRTAAFLVDEILAHLIIAVIGMLVPFFGHLLLSFIYSSAQDNMMGAGRSWGRSMVKQRLMTVDGREVSHATAVKRNAIRWLMWLTGVLFLVDVGLFFFGNGRLMVDHIFDTHVAEDPRYVGGSSATQEASSTAEREVDLWGSEGASFVDAEPSQVVSDVEDMSDWERRFKEEPEEVVEPVVERW